ncbi:MAG TPA: hypothetical protein VHZ07_12165 [Bryobacteraceae bacterium]|nr:hypothetical protein [Bryobacteraceae bacterium]
MATPASAADPRDRVPATIYSRWPIPIAAVLINLSISSVYALSVFNRPINALFPHPLFALFQAPYITFSTCIVLTGHGWSARGRGSPPVGPQRCSGLALIMGGRVDSGCGRGKPRETGSA